MKETAATTAAIGHGAIDACKPSASAPNTTVNDTLCVSEESVDFGLQVIGKRRFVADLAKHLVEILVADFLAGVESGNPTQPDFRNALQTQRVCDAVLESARSGSWMETGVEA